MSSHLWSILRAGKRGRESCGGEHPRSGFPCRAGLPPQWWCFVRQIVERPRGDAPDEKPDAAPLPAYGLSLRRISGYALAPWRETERKLRTLPVYRPGHAYRRFTGGYYRGADKLLRGGKVTRCHTDGGLPPSPDYRSARAACDGGEPGGAGRNRVSLPWPLSPFSPPVLRCPGPTAHNMRFTGRIDGVMGGSPGMENFRSPSEGIMSAGLPGGTTG